MFPNRGILSHTYRGQDTTLGTVVRQHTTYHLEFRCPPLRLSPLVRSGRTVWVVIITMGNRCIRRSTTTNLRCLPASYQARHKGRKGYPHTPRSTRTATMAKASRTHHPILVLLFLAHINSMHAGPSIMDRGNLIDLMPKTQQRVTILLVVLQLTYLKPTSCFSPSCDAVQHPCRKNILFSFLPFVLDSITATRVQSPRVSPTSA